MPDREVRFPGRSWPQIEALPDAQRWAVLRTLAHLVDEPVPSLADPWPEDGPLRGAYRLHLPADGVVIWYVVTPYEGEEFISVQYVQAVT